MSDKRRQRTLLVALAVVLALAAIRVAGGLFSGGGGPSVSGLDGARDDESELDLPPLVDLRLADLEKKPAEFSPGRDPFRFYVPPPPPKPKPAAPPRRPPPRPRPQRAQAPPKPPKPQPPPVTVTFLGSFGPAQGRIAVFTDGNDLYNARVGDVVKEHFVVASIGFESADLSYVNFPDAPPARLAAGG